MSLLALLLVVLSASLHVGWNSFAKHANQHAFLPLAYFLGGALCLPAVFFASDILFAPQMLGLLLATGLFQAVYILGLFLCYRHSDISKSYPLLRGLPVLSVALISPLFFSINGLSVQGWLGVAVIVLGAVWMSREAQSKHSLQKNSQKKSGKQGRVFSIYALAGIVLAIVGTTGYSLIDALAMKQLNSGVGLWQQQTTNALAFASAQAMSCSLWFLLFYARSIFAFLFSRGELGEVQSQAWRPLPMMASGLFIMVSYGLILLSMPLVEDVSLIVALRQISIPMGIAAGFFLFRERFGWQRCAAGLVIFGGVILISV